MLDQTWANANHEKGKRSLTTICSSMAMAFTNGQKYFLHVFGSIAPPEPPAAALPPSCFG